MVTKAQLRKIAESAVITDQYSRQLRRVRRAGQQTDKIAATVGEVLAKLPSGLSSLVVYGDPQSGKTEMMICLTAGLLDAGHKTIVHLMNDSVDLMRQNLERFQLAGLSPAPRPLSDLTAAPLIRGHAAIIFCKKNARDLEKLIVGIKRSRPVVVIDDEADFATPNAKINKHEVTKINRLVGTLLGTNGTYIGVTATPARLNLNNTFNNRAETWVQFLPHDHYTGQDDFFPLSSTVGFRLTLIAGGGSPADAHRALARFLVTVAHLNLKREAAGTREENYSMLVHTSGRTADHLADRRVIEEAMQALVDRRGKRFDEFLKRIYVEAEALYPNSDAAEVTGYVVKNAPRRSIVVLNSQRDRAAAGDRPTEPTSPFTVIIGGNIVSRGVTFRNLLAMFFTRDVATRLQQDTYIQRARMFGTRGHYLEHFELTIPRSLYADWHRCFVFHRLALDAIRNNKASPVWLGDPRISIASPSSIDRSTVDLDKGEMSFQIFDVGNVASLDAMVEAGPTSLNTLRNLAKVIGDAMPAFLVEYLEAALKIAPGTLAIHKATSIAGYNAADQDAISRRRGFIGTNQLEKSKYPNATHHVKIFFNGHSKGRVFYKNLGGVQFVQNVK